MIKEKNKKRITGKKSKQFISLAMALTFIGVVVFSGYAYEPKDYTNSDINEDAKQAMDLENEENLVKPERKAAIIKRFVRRAKKANDGVFDVKSDFDFIKEARELGLAPRQYRMIQVLQVLDSQITVEEYKDAKDFEIIQKINELAVDNDLIENLDEDTKAIIKRAQEFTERKQNLEKVCDEAKELGLAPKQYRMIQVLQVLDPQITVEEYKDAKGFEIIQKINELAVDNDLIESLDEDTKAIIKRAQEFTERKQNKERVRDEEGPRNRRENTRDPKNGLGQRRGNNGLNPNADDVSAEEAKQDNQI